MPADVVIARVVKAHTRALLAIAAAAVLLALLGTAALSLAGTHGRDAPMIAGLTLLGAGQLLAICGAALVLRGLLKVLGRAGEPGSAEAARAAQQGRPVAVLRATSKNLVTLIKVIIATAILGIVVWTIVNSAGVVGAIVGAVLIVQVAVIVALVRVGILHGALREVEEAAPKAR